jgi:putative ABC transport system permease protein
MDGYAQTARGFYASNNVEDGQFSVLGVITRSQENYIRDELGTLTERNDSIDYELEENRVIRLLRANREINEPIVTRGKPVSSDAEMLIDEKFADANGYEIGDRVEIGRHIYTVSGFGISPDYVYTIRNMSDVLNSPKTFGVGYVSDYLFDRVETEKIYNEVNSYSYKLAEGNFDYLFDYLRENFELVDLVKVEDNSRINTIFDDVGGPKKMSMVMGGLLIFIVSFIISISTANGIKRESQVIGILLAQGFDKKELVRHYLTLPMILTAIGSAVGYAAGVLISAPLINIQTEYNVPAIQLKDSAYLMLIGLGTPLIIAFLTANVTISRFLNKTPLSLLRGAASSVTVSNVEKRFNRLGGPFFFRFRVKNLLREKSGFIVLFSGVFLSAVLLNMAFYIRDSANHYITTLQNQLPYQYMYILKDFNATSDFEKKAEKTVIKNMKLLIAGDEKSVLLQGLAVDGRYYAIDALERLDDRQVVISTALRKKFGVDIGDELALFDQTKGEEYAIQVADVFDYDVGQIIFTSYSNFFKITENPARYYNALLADEDLGVNENDASAYVDKTGAMESIDALLDMLRVMSSLIISVAVLILIIVVYTLMQLILEREKINISMIKLFGYRDNEINALYTRGNIMNVLTAFALSLPVSRLAAQKFYDGIFYNMQQYLEAYIEKSSLIMSFAAALAGYFASMLIIKRSVGKIPFSEAIKNRE